MEIINLNTEKGKQVIQQIISDPPVVLIGSGVSIWQPTNLPAGNQFADQLFNLLFPESFLNNLETKSIVEEYFKGNNEDIPGLPFELLFEGCPNRKKITSIFKHTFSTGLYNPVHEAIARHFLRDGFSDIITTNYDLCLDNLLGFGKLSIKSDITRITTQDDLTSDSGKIYFKIHGSADDVKGETLVFALSQESRLPGWKRGLLLKIFERNPSLLIIGYSGSDFEICPEFFALPIEQIFWNIRNTTLPSLNAKRLAEEKPILFLEGDMRRFLSDMMGIKVETERGTSNELVRSIESDFTVQELIQWRIFLLNRIGFPLAALQAYEELETLPLTTEDRIKAGRLKSRSLFHLGKYKASADLCATLAREAKGIDRVLQADLLIEASTAYRCYGKLHKSSLLMDNAKKVVERIKGKEKKRILSLIYLCQGGSLLYIYPFRKLMEILTIGIMRKESKRIKDEIYENCRNACEYALESGNWIAFQESALWIQQMGIEISDLTKGMGYPPPPSPREGYRYLASYVPQVIEARNKLKYGKGPLNLDEEKELDELLQFCKMTGNNPEVWKLLLTKIKRNKLRRGIINDLKEFLYFNMLCEYNLLFRALFPLFQIKT